MTNMKTFLACLLFPFALVSCKKNDGKMDENGMLGVYYDFSTNIKIEDSHGTDLLDKRNEGHYTSDDIDIVVYQGKKVVAYQDIPLAPGKPILSNKKGYSIVGSQSDGYVLLLFFDLKSNKDPMSTKYLRIGKNGKIYAIKGEAKTFRSENGSNSLGGGGGSTATERVWLDGKLVWEVDKDEKLPLGNRNPEITIVVPKGE